MRSARVLRRKTTLMRNRAAPLALAVGLLTASLPARAVIVSTDDDEVIDGIPFRNDDLVALDETPGSAELWLDGATVFADDPLGDPNLDALAFLPGGNILLSTASSGVIGGLAVKDGDLVELDLETGIASLFLQEGAQGQPVDVDGVDVLSNGHLLLSFQKEELLDGQLVHDGDVIEYDIESNTFTFFLSENEIFDVD
jgi:hypothetical protein